MSNEEVKLYEKYSKFPFHKYVFIYIWKAKLRKSEILGVEIAQIFTS